MKQGHSDTVTSMIGVPPRPEQGCGGEPLTLAVQALAASVRTITEHYAQTGRPLPDLGAVDC